MFQISIVPHLNPNLPTATSLQNTPRRILDFRNLEEGDDDETVIINNTLKRTAGNHNKISCLKAKRQNRYRTRKDATSDLKQTEGENPNCSVYFSNFVSQGGAIVTPKYHKPAKTPWESLNRANCGRTNLFTLKH